MTNLIHLKVIMTCFNYKTVIITNRVQSFMNKCNQVILSKGRISHTIPTCTGVDVQYTHVSYKID